MPLKIELEPNPEVVLPEGLDIGIRFGLRELNNNEPIDAQTFLVGFLQRLLLQREKLEKDLLVSENHPPQSALSPNIANKSLGPVGYLPWSEE